VPTELVIPSAGESITEVQIGEWHKREGDFVERDEVVVEIETDKASMEISAPVAGRLTRVQKKAGESAAVGDVIGLIDESAKDTGDAKETRRARGDGAAKPDGDAKAERGPAKGAAPQEKPSAGPAPGAAAAAKAERGNGAEAPIMPAARRLLDEHGLDARDIRATGPGGRLLKEDVLRHIAEQSAEKPAPRPVTEPEAAAKSRAPAMSSAPAAPAATPHRDEEAVPMTMIRRRIAERLVEAQQHTALLTTFNEVDMSAVMELRSQRGEEFLKRYNVKLGFMSLFVKAAVDALKMIPQVNAEIRGTDIIYKNYYDIGVAVSTDHGLVVPVLRGADRLSFAEIEIAIGELAKRARDRKLSIDELQGGTFTISNGGVFGSLLSTPIVNPPQSGILGLHAIQDRPVARDGQVVIRPMMYVALTYDHRIIDGRESVTFLKRIKECVEDPTRMLLEA